MNFFEWRYARFHSAVCDAADYLHFSRYHKHGFDFRHNSCKYVLPLLKTVFGNGVSNKDAKESVAKECEKVASDFTDKDGAKKPGWMKTPGGKRTSLPEFLWLLIRTKAFRKLFGLWDKKSVADEILAEDSIKAPGNLLKMQPSERRKTAKILYNRLRAGEPITAPDGREIHFSGVGIREIMSHSADPHTLSLTEILPQVISSMHYFGEGDVKPTDVNIKAYHLYARRVNLGDGEMVARIVIREDQNGNFFYDEESADLSFLQEIYERNPVNKTTRNPITRKSRQDSFAQHSLPEFFSEVKRGEENLEKFGSENGEPTVSAIEHFLNR